MSDGLLVAAAIDNSLVTGKGTYITLNLTGSTAAANVTGLCTCSLTGNGLMYSKVRNEEKSSKSGGGGGGGIERKRCRGKRCVKEEDVFFYSEQKQ